MALDKQILLSQLYEILHDIRRDYFNLKYPVILKVSTEKKFCSKYAGLYQEKLENEKLVAHEITLAYCASKDVFYAAETLAHELVHALQNERGEGLSHNKSFFSRLDYILVNIGLPITSLEYRHAIKKY